MARWCRRRPAAMASRTAVPVAVAVRLVDPAATAKRANRSVLYNEISNLEFTITIVTGRWGLKPERPTFVPAPSPSHPAATGLGCLGLLLGKDAFKMRREQGLVDPWKATHPPDAALRLKVPVGFWRLRIICNVPGAFPLRMNVLRPNGGRRLHPPDRNRRTPCTGPIPTRCRMRRLPPPWSCHCAAARRSPNRSTLSAVSVPSS